MLSFDTSSRALTNHADLMGVVREAASNGISAYEFWWKGDEDLDALESIQKDLDIICAGFTLSSPDRLTWWKASEKEIVECMRPQMETARRLNVPSLFADIGHDFDNNIHNVRKARKALTTMCGICSDAGIRLCLEPIVSSSDKEVSREPLSPWLRVRPNEWSRVCRPMEISAELISEVNSPAIAAVYELDLWETCYFTPDGEYYDHWPVSVRLDEQTVENCLIADLTKYQSIIGHIHLFLAFEDNKLFRLKRKYPNIFDALFTTAIEQALVFEAIGNWKPESTSPIHIGLHFDTR